MATKEEKSTWKTIVSILKAHPKAIYQLGSFAVASYTHLPYILLFIKYAPLLWMGYNVYSSFPPGMSFVILGLLCKITG